MTRVIISELFLLGSSQTLVKVVSLEPTTEGGEIMGLNFRVPFFGCSERTKRTTFATVALEKIKAKKAMASPTKGVGYSRHLNSCCAGIEAWKMSYS